MMIKHQSKIVETTTHGRSISYLVRTNNRNMAPEPITCMATFIRNLFDINIGDSDGLGKIVIKYSRNNGPVQNVELRYDSDHEFIISDLIKLDVDLVRGADGESMAFYIDSDYTITNAAMLVNVGHTERGQQPMSTLARTLDVGEGVRHDLFISGLDSNGMLARNDLYIVDTKMISIIKPKSMQSLDYIELDRWYPSNTIQQEENKLTIYPVDDIGAYDLDMFTIFGGAGDVPLVIQSCSVAVPNKYECVATRVATRVATAITDIPTLFNVPTPFNESTDFSQMSFQVIGTPNFSYNNPYPFSIGGLPNVWPDRIFGQEHVRSMNGQYVVCTFSKNGSEPKTIIWNTSNNVEHHTVWDSIKELFLDEQGRTAFVLDGFNGRNLTTSMLHGITSNGAILRTDNYEEQLSPGSFSDTAGAFTIKDRVITFANQNEGLVWSENTLTFYPTPIEFATEIVYNDYYNFLCERTEQVEAGNPITIHSCAVIEPEANIRPNTKVTVDTSQLDGSNNISASIQINDKSVKTFKIERQEIDLGIGRMFDYINFLDAPLTIGLHPNPGDVVNDDYVNMRYFKQLNSEHTVNKVEISGCSGSEYADEYISGTEYTNPSDPGNVPVHLASYTLHDEQTNIRLQREVNKVTFIKNTLPGYLDFFDMLDGVSGERHVVYSSAGIPTLMIDDNLPPDIDDPTLPVYTPIEINVTTSDTTNTSRTLQLEVQGIYPDYLIVIDNTIIVDANNTYPSISVTDYDGFTTIELKNPDINKTVNYKLYIKGTKFKVLGNQTSPDAITHVELVTFGDYIPTYMFDMSDIMLTPPAYLPIHITSLQDMFTGNLFNADISTWSTSHVTNMQDTFKGCYSFNQPLDSWDVSNVTSMNSMFSGCVAFNQPLNSWSTAKVTDMDVMFSTAQAFNQDLSDWNVLNIAVKPSRFDNNANTWTLPRPNWGTDGASVILPTGTPFSFNMTAPARGGFYLSLGEVVGDWFVLENDVVIRSGSGTLYDERIVQHTPGDVTIKIYGNSDYISITNDTMISFTVNEFGDTAPNVRLALNYVPLIVPTSIPTTLTNLTSMFKQTYNFNQDISEWDTSHVTDMSQMFLGCALFNQDISNWNTSKVTNMDDMFNNATAFNQDLSNWDVAHIPSKPNTFDEYANQWVLPKPMWGITETVSSPNPVIHYEFNGNFLDSSANNITTTPSGNGEFVLGRNDKQCYKFINARLDTETVLPINSDKVSVSFWMSTTQTTTGFLFNSNNGANGFSAGNRLQNTPQITLESTSGYLQNMTSADLIDTGEWVHYLVEIDRSRGALDMGRIYINGELAVVSKASEYDTTGNFVNSILSVGNKLNSSYPFVGKLQDFKIYNVILTANQRAMLLTEV